MLKKLFEWLGVVVAYFVISSVGAYALLGFFGYWD